MAETSRPSLAPSLAPQVRPPWIWRPLAILLIVALGLATRKAPGLFPDVLVIYGGDTLYATLWVQLFAFFARSWSIRVVSLAALATCWTIEASQALHLDWLDVLRATTPGALVLGRGFLWSDLVCYVVGVIIGAGMEHALRRGPT